ncbi:hypothetical protein AB0E62_35905 [Streptomyces sp. NPDC038707]|uniref:hypothetical protein n=1 Tax=Streptomyces sp. NPDC038707 TaxID=3154329 RepID=UPI0033ECC5F5
MPHDPQPRRHLRDSAKVCPHHITVPGEGPLRCELDVDHDGLHAHECMRWGSQHSDRRTHTRPSA